VKNEKTDNNMDVKLNDCFENWAQNGDVSAKKSAQLENMVSRLDHKEKKLRFSWIIGSILTVLVGFFIFTVISPVVFIWASENIPVIGQHIPEQEISPISQEPLQKLNRRIEVNKNIEIPIGELILTELVFAPGQTVLKFSYTDNDYNGRGARIRFSTCELIGPRGNIESLGANATGTMEGNTWKEEYNLEFQGLDTIPATLTCKINACIYSEKKNNRPA